ncbi:MAG: hypothetical protein ACRDQ0_12245 [Pseudonocardia sp.]
MDFTAEPATTAPAHWHALLGGTFTGQETDALTAAGGRVENAYVAHRKSLRHQAASDRAHCPVCDALGEAMIALLGMAEAARFLPLGALVKYHGSLTHAHGFYVVVAAGWDDDGAFYRLSDRAGGVVLWGVWPEDVTPV